MPSISDIVSIGAARANVDPSLVLAIGTAEGNFSANQVSTTGVQGAFQITQATWKSLRPGVPYSKDLGEQAYTASLLISQIQNSGLHAPELIYAAYNAGPGVALDMQKDMSNGMTFAQAAANRAGSASKAAEITGGANRMNKALGNKTPNTQGGAAGTEAARIEGVEPLTGVPLVSDPVSGAILEETEMKLVDYTDLDNEEWWKDGLVGNPHLKRIATPVTFKLSLSELTNEFLPRSQSDSAPLELRLNCSLSSVQQQMKHVVNKASTRTGFHMTFWGMEPDLITGSGSTGVFMNSFGLSSLMSLEGTLDELGLQDTVDKADNAQNIYRAIKETDSSKRLRVAAQDAFIELLSLFKNNGMVRFKTDNYTASFDNRTQLSKSVWSTQYGASTYERKARNNDIMSKGQVFMTFKGSVYQGYFKSLQWTMDAASPFHWKFDFTFQVQRTINYVMYPR